MKELYQSIQELLFDLFQKEVKVMEEKRIMGGAINDAFLLRLDNGKEVFLKTNVKDMFDMFIKERTGIQAIYDTHTIQTPEIYGIGVDDERNCSFIMMEYLCASRNQDYYRVFGQELAKMHLADTKAYTGLKTYGFVEDNYIGSTPQRNECYDSWIDFYRECRMRPQFEMAKGYFQEEDLEACEGLLKNLDKYLIEPKYPSLLHGDLWEGNSTVGRDGKAWLIDPACYVGHYETDLAMMELYGGFSPELFKAYYEIIPQETGYEVRRDIYQLYHVINHLNLFGDRYLAQTRHLIYKYAK